MIAFARLFSEALGIRLGPSVAGDFHVPSRISLARTLFESWLAEA